MNNKTLIELGMAEHGFRLNTIGLMNEIANSGLVHNAGVLKVPLNILMRYLNSIAERASQLNDPILNKIMVDMALYESADPFSKEYDKELIKEVYSIAQDYRAKNINNQ